MTGDILVNITKLANITIFETTIKGNSKEYPKNYI